MPIQRNPQVAVPFSSNTNEPNVAAFGHVLQPTIEAAGGSGGRASRKPSNVGKDRTVLFQLCAKLPFKEKLGLAGQHRRQRGKALRQRSSLATLLSAWRSATMGLLLLLLLAPYGSALLLLTGPESSSCGMQCCKRSKVCCCRKASKNARQGGPGWTSTAKCPGGCGQLPNVSGTAVAGLVATGIKGSPVLPVSHIRSSRVSPRDSSGTAFALFERPPPASRLTLTL